MVDGTTVLAKRLARWSGNLFAGITLILFPAAAGAIDLLPFDYRPPPPGTNAFLAYYIHSSAEEFEPASGDTIEQGTSLDAHIAAFRLTRWEEIAGVPVAGQVILPFATVDNARLGGAQLNEPSGLLDPTLAAAFWPISQPEKKRWLAVANFLTFPLGNFDRGEAVTLGENRWRNDLQIGLTQGLPNNFSLDLTGDVIVYGDNDDGGNGRQKLEQDPTFEAYAWLTYNFDPGTWAAIGYQGSFGGDQQLDGVDNGLATKFQQVRAGYGKFLTPGVQLIGTLGHDVTASGGFRRDYILQLRFLALF